MIARLLGVAGTLYFRHAESVPKTKPTWTSTVMSASRNASHLNRHDRAPQKARATIRHTEYLSKHSKECSNAGTSICCRPIVTTSHSQSTTPNRDNDVAATLRGDQRVAIRVSQPGTNLTQPLNIATRRDDNTNIRVARPAGTVSIDQPCINRLNEIPGRLSMLFDTD